MRVHQRIQGDGTLPWHPKDLPVPEAAAVGVPASFTTALRSAASRDWISSAG